MIIYYAAIDFCKSEDDKFYYYDPCYSKDPRLLQQLQTVVRHEFGHSLGLIHSTAPEDLMAPVVTTAYPFISECDVDAITSLYNGNELSQVICEK